MNVDWDMVLLAGVAVYVVNILQGIAKDIAVIRYNSDLTQQHTKDTAELSEMQHEKLDSIHSSLIDLNTTVDKLR